MFNRSRDSMSRLFSHLKAYFATRGLQIIRLFDIETDDE